jgi:phage RecT family recombinase
MNEQPQNLMQLIQTASPSQLIDSPQVADRFKDLYRVVHGIKDARVADAFYTAEKFHFLKLVNDSPNLQSCTKLSLYGIFMDVAVSGLSFDPSMKHLYIVPYNINVGTKEAPKWEKRAALQISGIGELLLRQIQGQVKYADNPVVVFQGDEFRYGCRDGRTIVEHMACIPRQSDTIIASYICITRHDGSKDYKVMAMEDIMRLKKFSKDPNSKAWTDGLKGMVEAKTIKHAFKNYPKVRMGEFSRLASETIDEEAELAPDQPVLQQSYQAPQQLPNYIPQQDLPDEWQMPLNNVAPQMQPQQLQQPAPVSNGLAMDF